MGDQATGLLSPFLRARRIAAALPYLEGSVLDYGCGVGALADHIPPQRYVGVDDDAASLDIAKTLHPSHSFFISSHLDVIEGAFDTIALLAVIEHLEGCVELFKKFHSLCTQNGRMVITTPAPVAGPLHRFGANLGLFSREAHEDHKDLYGREEIALMAKSCGFYVAVEKRFLLWMNQLFVLEKK